MIFNKKTILITGGTGSFGQKFIETVAKSYKPKKIIIYSRDELKQFDLQKKIRANHLYRFFIGDVRDLDRLNKAMEGVDYVVHAAALKQVPATEYNPFEAIKTNIIGAKNVIDAAIENNVKKVIALSTDKAAAPINLYGATKLASDKLFISANNFIGKKDIKFSVVRYGNVMGSRGSVIPYFIEKAKSGELPITDPLMTRFNISLKESVKMVIWALCNLQGGELFVPKLKSYKITDLAEAIGPNCSKPIIGIRSGEKIHEEMITIPDSFSTIKLDKYFAILPPDKKILEVYKKQKIKFENFEPNTSYNSGSNKEFLNVEEIRRLIRENIDQNFSPQ